MGAKKKKKERREGKREYKRKGRKGVGIKKDWRQDKKEFKGEEKERCLLLALNQSGQFCWSSCGLIFQYPLSLVSDLHISWNTVGCSLCSSDQLGISLALRGSGLRSHLCCHHLQILYLLKSCYHLEHCCLLYLIIKNML